MAWSIESTEDSLKGGQPPAADTAAGTDVAEVVTPPRRFYANPADL